MGLIKIEKNQIAAPGILKNPAPGSGANSLYEQLKPALDRFFNDIENDKSSFFDLPVKYSFHDEWTTLRPQLAANIPQVDTFLHLGIGGSSLGAEAIVKALAPADSLKFHFLDNIDPDSLWDTLENINPKKTLVYVVTKSGTTMETLAQFSFILTWLEKHLGQENAKKHLVFCTDPVVGDLRALSHAWQVPAFSIPRNLGGRFSALSGVGLFPAALAKINSDEILEGARLYRASILDELKSNCVPAVFELAWQLVHHYQNNKRNVTVLMPYSQKLKTMGAWFTQLWAESLGKNNLGITPVAAVGPTDQHSILQLLRDGPQDKVVGFVEIAGFHKMIDLKWNGPKMNALDTVTGMTLNQLVDAELGATRQVLTNNQRPHFTIQLPRLNANTLGQLIFLLETLTAVSGYILGIDPYDQPGVEEGKKLTHERIRACKKGTIA